jgi:cell wall-associated NlpC family hydrolase
MSKHRAVTMLSALLSAVLITGLFAGPAAANTSFRDVTGSVHAPAVSALATEDIVRGCTDDRFCPSRGLTRGQVASILFRALDLSPATGGSRFDDTGTSVHRAAIDAVAEAGVTLGCTSRSFCPNDPISRGQLATLLVRALEVPAAPAGTYFTDSGGVHGSSIDALAVAGIAQGCSLVEFCSGDRLSRAQGATFVARGLQLVPRVELASFSEREAQHRAASASAATTTSSAGARAVAVAVAQVGKPYQWGGNGPSSFDCSGLTRYAWRAAGVELPRVSRDQYSGTRRISRSDLQPGDLIFYHSPISHVAMYIGDGRVVEAPYSGNQVRISSTGLTRSGIVGYGRPR